MLEAFVRLGLNDYLNDLEKTNNEFQKLRSKRSLDIDNRPPIGDVLIEREAQGVLRLFFSQVNTYQQTFKEIDYTSFISEINVLLTVHSKTIRTRIATNKRRARKKAAAAAKLKAKDKLKIEPGFKTEDKPQTNKSNDLDKSVGVSSLNADSLDDTVDSTSIDKKQNNRQDDSSKKDSKSKRGANGKGKKGLNRSNKKNREGNDD